MAYETILFQVEEGIARITLNRPQSLNAITPAMLDELNDALLEAANNVNAKVIVITGAGKAFCAGVDLKSLGERKLVNGRVGDVLDIPGQALSETIRTMPKVIIALVNGYCFTGALELVLACDLAIASETARIGDTHAKWGIRPTWGMSARLPRHVGFLKAREMSFTADAISGKEAEHIGLVNLAVPLDQLENALKNVAQKIMGNSEQVIAAYKQLYNAGESLSLNESLELELTSDFEITDTESRIKSFRKQAG
jgi:enoyl-CoA hydratase